MAESAGITTVSFSINKAISQKIGAPRSVLVKFPYGAVLGEPGHRDQQRTILRDAFWAAQDSTAPGVIVETDHRWRRSTYAAVPSESFARTSSAADPV